jgi:hypothetical protein
MVLHGKRQIGPMYLTVLLLQLRKRMVGVQLVQDMAVDVNEIASVGALSDQMKVPNLIEQSARHRVLTFEGLAEKDAGVAAGYLGRAHRSRQAVKARSEARMSDAKSELRRATPSCRISPR